MRILSGTNKRLLLSKLLINQVHMTSTKQRSVVLTQKTYCESLRSHSSVVEPRAKLVAPLGFKECRDQLHVSTGPSHDLQFWLTSKPGPNGLVSDAFRQSYPTLEWYSRNC